MSRLTWDDLLLQDITPEQFRDWISPWTGVVNGRVAPAFMSKFGFWFLRRPEGHVEMLDVFTGQVERMADTYDDFIREVNEQWWHETYLFSELVFQLHQANKVPGPGQCYALASAGGSTNKEKRLPVSGPARQNGYSIRDGALPLGHRRGGPQRCPRN